MKAFSLPPGAAADDTVLTTREAARLLGVAVSTAQLWMERGDIASWKTPGGHRRCHLSAVLNLVQRAHPQNLPSGSSQAASVPLAREFLAESRPSYPVLDCEPARLAALAASGLIDSAAEPAFDRITWLATQISNCPVALVSLLTSERQWFKSRQGIDTQETPRGQAFCSYAIMQAEGILVEDARLDPRFHDNPLVTGEPHIVFYAGIPVTDADDQRLGTLCVLDYQPRRLSPEQMRALRELGALTSEEIARRT